MQKQTTSAEFSANLFVESEQKDTEDQSAINLNEENTHGLHHISEILNVMFPEIFNNCINR